MNMVIDGLLDFCKKYQHLFLYGCGIHAFVIYTFLCEYKIEISGCIITDSVNEPENKFLGKMPVISIREFEVNSNIDYGIVLALPTVYHADVKKCIDDVFSSNATVFELSDADVEDVRGAYWCKRRYERMLRLTDDKLQNPLFDKRIEDIQKKYTHINLRFIDLKVIGSYVSWIFNCWKYLGCDAYYLYYPITIYENSTNKDEIEGVNKYLISKLDLENVTVVSWDNIDFWRYFYKKSKSFFLVDDECNLANWNNEFNLYLYNLQKNQPDYLLRKNYVRLSDEEVKRGEEGLRSIGGTEIVCLCVRDNSYNKQISKLSSNSHLMSSKYRNASIENYKTAMEGLYKYNLNVVRMGAVVEKKIYWNNTIDYASKYRTEFMDVYLFKKCRFSVTTLCGITTLANLFSKPLVITNSSLLSTRGDYSPITVRSRDLIIFKKFWWPEKKRYLSFREMLERETDNIKHPTVTITTFSTYEKDKIVSIENTPKEINDVVQEMIDRLNGTIVYTEEDEILQKKFFDIIDTFDMHNNVPLMCRVGAAFLRENQWLLD